MALDSNGRIGKWSHMRSNLEEYSWGLGPKKFEKLKKITKMALEPQNGMRFGLFRTFLYAATEYDVPGALG